MILELAACGSWRPGTARARPSGRTSSASSCSRSRAATSSARASRGGARPDRSLGICLPRRGGRHRLAARHLGADHPLVPPGELALDEAFQLFGGGASRRRSSSSCLRPCCSGACRRSQRSPSSGAGGVRRVTREGASSPPRPRGASRNLRDHVFRAPFARRSRARSPPRGSSSRCSAPSSSPRRWRRGGRARGSRGRDALDRPPRSIGSVPRAGSGLARPRRGGVALPEPARRRGRGAGTQDAAPPGERGPRLVPVGLAGARRAGSPDGYYYNLFALPPWWSGRTDGVWRDSASSASAPARRGACSGGAHAGRPGGSRRSARRSTPASSRWERGGSTSRSGIRAAVCSPAGTPASPRVLAGTVRRDRARRLREPDGDPRAPVLAASSSRRSATAWSPADGSRSTSADSASRIPSSRPSRAPRRRPSASGSSRCAFRSRGTACSSCGAGAEPPATRRNRLAGRRRASSARGSAALALTGGSRWFSPDAAPVLTDDLNRSPPSNASSVEHGRDRWLLSR
jgi:hypothetical protein